MVKHRIECCCFVVYFHLIMATEMFNVFLMTMALAKESMCGSGSKPIEESSPNWITYSIYAKWTLLLQLIGQVHFHQKGCLVNW